MSPLEQYFLEHPESRALADFLVWMAFGLAAWALALMILALTPRRHAAAVDALVDRPWRCCALGSAFMLLPFTILMWMLATQRAHAGGFFTLLLILLIAASVGLSVCGRALGERLVPQRGATAATALGAGLVVATMPLVPIGLALVVLFGCLGVGAMLWPADRAE